ncbi:MAG: hypothetical protein DWH78_00855 [Planctomycetota bacterium]|jgi:hypothetical protein|nr:MAG: hypothetical protein DWH78_00855 [Planctomycetota bacterium]
MADDSPDNFPLVERFHKAEYLARELSEHLRQAFLPKLAQLRQASKIMDAAEVTDQTMLDNMNAVFAAEDFASDIFEKLIRYLRSIEKDTHEILGISE